MPKSPAGRKFFSFTDRFEGDFSRKQDGAGASIHWIRQWMGDLDTACKVFVQIAGRYYIDAEDLTLIQDT
ncbi:hypothetical protein ACFH04_41815 [Streptomyces noboritoensis]|uniref:Uncharacterized protein n=1 Tax=Streptomyces noboritoensis TaxID=67337 RepID=A0ABV6TER8_9ACTN